eukprot:10191476-Alexandrium_andersonii.AAC.1
MLTALMADHTLVLPMYNKFKELLDSRLDPKLDVNQYFVKLSTVLKCEDQALVVKYLQDVSDMSQAELMACARHDEDSFVQLLEMDT